MDPAERTRMCAVKNQAKFMKSELNEIVNDEKHSMEGMLRRTLNLDAFRRECANVLMIVRAISYLNAIIQEIDMILE